MTRLLLALVATLLLITSAQAQVLNNNTAYPAGALPIASSSGNVAAATATATLAARAGYLTYICGFEATGGGATAAATVNVTVTNVPGGTMTWNFGVPTGVDAPAVALVKVFNPCMPATAINTSIVVSMPTLGAGNAHAAVNASGYQLASP
ncbi:MAG TPA: hypothetical protein VFV12_08825 [Xanthobacteraceae bacterium]|nr:hypothetical protein [Xanthobacteraceae bacterium]